MKQPQKNDLLDEAMRLIYLDLLREIDTSSDDEDKLSFMEDVKYSKTISSDIKNKMINKLFNEVVVLSFGELISQHLLKKQLAPDQLAEEIKVSSEVIERLKHDATFIHLIPSKYLRELIKEMKISYKLAEQSILKTVNIIKSQFAAGNLTFQTLSGVNGYSNIALSYNSSKASIAKNVNELLAIDSKTKAYLAELEELCSK